jgi:hypothetical protein
MPEDNDKPEDHDKPEEHDQPADSAGKAQGEKAEGADKPIRKLFNRIWGFVGALAVIGGVIGLGSQVFDWFSGSSPASASTCRLPTSTEVERSPNLGISFHQGNKLARMSYLNFGGLQIPVMGVCLSSAPFEIWFPALSGPQAHVGICISPTAAIFSVNPFKIDLPRGVGCLMEGVGVADNGRGSGFLPESSPQEPASYFVDSQRAEPAGDGEDKYFVSRLSSVPASESLAEHTILLSAQRANLYVIIYASSNYGPPYSDSYLEHFVLHFS